MRGKKTWKRRNFEHIFQDMLSIVTFIFLQFSSVAQSCPKFATPGTAACQASLSITNSRSPLKLMSIELVMPSNHCILCLPLLLPLNLVSDLLIVLKSRKVSIDSATILDSKEEDKALACLPRISLHPVLSQELPWNLQVWLLEECCLL